MKKRVKKLEGFTHRLLNLLSEPQFMRFENILREPNFFKIVGRSHFERWHSAFFGWLLDPNGSHLTRDFAIKKFMLLLLDSRCLKSSVNHGAFLLNELPLLELTEIDVTPNENLPTEMSVTGLGRFDVFCSAKYQQTSGQHRRLNLVFELKIDTKPSADQSKKYADWLYSSFPNDDNFLIYLLPILKNSSVDTVGDERWYCLDYQLINDKFLHPLLEHPGLNEKVKPFLIQYIKNLKTRHNGIKMAITDEEKRLATALYEKYSDVFDSIYDALVSTGMIDYSTSDIAPERGRDNGRLAVKIGGKLFANATVRLLFRDVLAHLVDSGQITRLPLPWGTSNQRYILTNEEPAVHPNGRAFFYPERHSGFTIETHYARDRGFKVLNDLCDKLELSFEKVDV